MESRFVTVAEIKKFQEITKLVKGVKLSDTEAEEQASRLIRLFELLKPGVKMKM